MGIEVRLPPGVVVVAYGRPDLLRRCLASVGRRLRVTVVDNGLDEEVRELCADAGACYVRPERNLGYAAGVNRALDVLDPDTDVLLLNPDAQITEADILRLQTALHEPGSYRAAVAPRLVRPDGSVERTVWPVPTPRVVWAGAAGLGDRAARGWTFLNGAVLMLNAKAVADVGRFDERFFLYGEETDWQVRARRAGWELHLCADVAAEHIGGACSSDSQRREQLFHAGAETFARKWYGTLGWLTFRTGSVVSAMRRAVTARTSVDRASHLRTVGLYVRGPRSRALPKDGTGPRTAA